MIHPTNGVFVGRQGGVSGPGVGNGIDDGSVAVSVDVEGAEGLHNDTHRAIRALVRLAVTGNICAIVRKMIALKGGNLAGAVDVEVRQQSIAGLVTCLLYTSPSQRDGLLSRMPSS